MKQSKGERESQRCVEESQSHYKYRRPPESKIRTLMSVNLTDQLMNSLFNISTDSLSQPAYRGLFGTKLKTLIMSSISCSIISFFRSLGAKKKIIFLLCSVLTGSFY